MNAPQSLVKSRRDRFLKTCGGFALLTLGVPMLFLPGPGAPAIVLGLTLLGGEYPWANKALSQLERPTQWLRGTMRPSLAWAKRYIQVAPKAVAPEETARRMASVQAAAQAQSASSTTSAHLS